MNNVRRAALRTIYVAVMLCLLVLAEIPQPARALQLTQRSLSLGTTAANATTTHTFSFTYVSTTPAGSIAFEYCTSPLELLPCVAPSGLDVSGVTLQQQTGETGFSVQSATANRIVLTRAATPTATVPATYVFAGAVNPSGIASTFYARISSYATADATGPNTDFGAVVNSTTRGVSISTEVPPILKFCVGQAIPSDCASASGNEVDLGNLVTAVASSGTSQMFAATNAALGLAITANGTTMTSGNNTIPPLSNPTPSAPGNAQFGINLRANSDPLIGQDPLGPGVANPTAGYNVPNRFKFIPGDVVATTPSTTDTRKFTVSYVVNVSPSQPPGVYTATLTYICTASF